MASVLPHAYRQTRVEKYTAVEYTHLPNAILHSPLALAFIIADSNSLLQGKSHYMIRNYIPLYLNITT